VLAERVEQADPRLNPHHVGHTIDRESDR
jgi:hypothetical protein